MNSTKNAVNGLQQFIIMLVIVVCLDSFIPQAFIRDVVSTCFLIYVYVLWIIYLHWALVKSDTKKNLLACGGLMLMMILIRGARYSAFQDAANVSRYLWYLYFIPNILVPYHSLKAALRVGRVDTGKPSRITVLVGIVSIGFVALILTNDFHQLVFRVTPEFRSLWVHQHPVFFQIISVWIYVLLIASFAVLILRCRTSSWRKYIWIPIIPIVWGTIVLILLPQGLMPKILGNEMIEYPESFCLAVSGTWLCCIKIGLVPANENYRKLIRVSSMPVQIRDKNHQIIYKNQDMLLGSEEVDHESQVMPDVLTYSKEIHGGYVYWQSDVRELNRLNQELQELNQELQEEANLIYMENELKERQASIEAKNKVYDAIAASVEPHLQEISAIVETSKADKMQRENLLEICFYGCYIKRMANFRLLAQNHDTISEMELGLAIAETLRWVRKLGVPADIQVDDDCGYFSTGKIIQAFKDYDGFLQVVARQITGIYVVVKGGICKLTFEGEEICLETDEQGIVIENDEDACFVRIDIAERRDAL